MRSDCVLTRSIVCKTVSVATTLIILLGIILTLRIGKTEEREGTLLTTWKFGKCEVVDSVLSIVSCKEARLTITICLNLTICRYGVVDIPAILMRSDCILTRSIGCNNTITVRDAYASSRCAVRVGYSTCNFNLWGLLERLKGHSNIVEQETVSLCCTQCTTDSNRRCICNIGKGYGILLPVREFITLKSQLFL